MAAANPTKLTTPTAMSRNGPDLQGPLRRGPTRARAHFAARDVLVCVSEDSFTRAAARPLGLAYGSSLASVCVAARWRFAR